MARAQKEPKTISVVRLEYGDGVDTRRSSYMQTETYCRETLGLSEAWLTARRAATC